MFNNVFDVFYKKVVDKDGKEEIYGIVKEAFNGRVYCSFPYNVKFNTIILEENVELIEDEDKISSTINEEEYFSYKDDIRTPTLVIKNLEEFRYLITYYVDKALDNYNKNNFDEEDWNSKFSENDMGISKEKVLMTLLWSNATHEDFNDPCSFLRKRINFFELGELEKYMEETILGYSENLKSDVSVQIVKNKLENETPYSMVINLYNHDTGEQLYEFPRVYFGIDNGVGYIYAVQNDRKRFISDKYLKKIERLLYKVNEGLDVKEDTYDNYGVGNLKDVTPNAVVAINILMGLFKNNGITKVKVPSLLITRWNSKMMILERKLSNLEKNTLEKIKDDYQEYLYLQSNLTEKFLRVFRRIGYHHSSIAINSYPGEVSNDLILDILDMEDVCNNQLLDETFNMVNRGDKRISR